jgi:hypothetical protein
MATKAQWEKQIVESGGKILPITGTPEWNRTKEGFAADFRTIENPEKGKLLKKIRDGLAKEMRNDGWKVIVEPKATFFTDKGIGEGYALSAIREK